MAFSNIGKFTAKKKKSTVQLAFEGLGLYDSALLHVCLSIQKVGTKSKVQKIIFLLHEYI